MAYAEIKTRLDLEPGAWEERDVAVHSGSRGQGRAPPREGVHRAAVEFALHVGCGVCSELAEPCGAALTQCSREWALLREGGLGPPNVKRPGVGAVAGPQWRC